MLNEQHSILERACIVWVDNRSSLPNELPTLTFVFYRCSPVIDADDATSQAKSLTSCLQL